MTDPLTDPEFRAQLATLRQLYSEAAGDYRDQQKAVLASLALLVTRLRETDLSADIVPLDALFIALRRVAQGKSYPLLDVHPNSAGGQPLSPEEEQVQSYGVALTDLMIEAGHREADAIKIVADSLAAGGALGTRSKRPVTPDVIRGWRFKANSGDAPKIRKEADDTLSRLRRLWEGGGQEWPMRRSEAQHFVGTFNKTDRFRMLNTPAKFAG